MDRKSILASLAVVLTVLWAQARDANSAETAFLASDAEIIEGPDGVTRILLDFEGLESLEGKGISSAFLNVPLSMSTPEADVDVQAFAIETAWRGGAPTWTRPWREAGGDLGHESSIVTLEAGVQSGGLRLNVTQVVRAIALEGRSANGILLTVPAGKRLGFTDEERSSLGDLEGSVLGVTYVNTVPTRVRTRE